jgi:hypothetical protein
MQLDNKEWPSEEWLDAALNKYGDSEPRPGLENRLLAVLRAEQQARAGRSWMAWPAVASLAAALLVVAGVFQTARQGEIPAIRSTPAAPLISRTSSVPTTQLGPSRTRGRRNEKRSLPRPEQFPSPQPLSEQERLLASYVEKFPREATIVARVQTAAFQEEDRELAKTENSQDPSQGEQP